MAGPDVLHPTPRRSADDDPTGALDEATFLRAVDERLRVLRARRGVTRRDLARLSGVSERHLAQLGSGSGNISILLLRRIARALGVGPEELVAAERPERSFERLLLEQTVAQLPESRLAEARSLLLRHLPGRWDARARGGCARR